MKSSRPPEVFGWRPLSLLRFGAGRSSISSLRFFFSVRSSDNLWMFACVFSSIILCCSFSSMFALVTTVDMLSIRGHIQTICEKINVIMTLTPGPPPPLASYRIITFMKVERLQSFTLLRDSIPRPYNTITYSSVVSTLHGQLILNNALLIKVMVLDPLPP